MVAEQWVVDKIFELDAEELAKLKNASGTKLFTGMGQNRAATLKAATKLFAQADRPTLTELITRSEANKAEKSNLLTLSRYWRSDAQQHLDGLLSARGQR